MRTILVLVLTTTAMTACGFSGPPLSGEAETDAGVGALDTATDASTIVADAHVAIDAPVPISTTLRETMSDVVAAGKGIYCSGGSSTMRDNQWYRVFRLSDFGITTIFNVTAIDFAVESAHSANQATVAIGLYAGSISIPSALVADSVSVPDNSPPISVPMSAMIPAGGSFIIEISDTDIYNSGGIAQKWFRLGATDTGSETMDGYFGSAACGETPQAVSSQLIIEVEGTHL